MNHRDELISYSQDFMKDIIPHIKNTTSYYIYISISFREQPEGLVDGRPGFTT